jgi:hypothetical protein
VASSNCSIRPDDARCSRGYSSKIHLTKRSYNASGSSASSISEAICDRSLELSAFIASSDDCLLAEEEEDEWERDMIALVGQSWTRVRFNAYLALLTRLSRVAHKRSHDPELRRTIAATGVSKYPFGLVSKTRHSTGLQLRELRSTEGNLISSLPLSFFMLVGLLRVPRYTVIDAHFQSGTTLVEISLGQWASVRI